MGGICFFVFADSPDDFPDDSNRTIEILEAKYKYTNIHKYKYTNIQIPISDSNDTIEILEAIYKYTNIQKNKYTNMQILISDSTRTSANFNFPRVSPHQPIMTIPASISHLNLHQYL